MVSNVTGVDPLGVQRTKEIMGKFAVQEKKRGIEVNKVS